MIPPNSASRRQETQTPANDYSATRQQAAGQHVAPQRPQPQQSPNETAYETMQRIYGEDSTKIAWLRFNGDRAQMIDWLNAQRNMEADRQRGNSYSIRAR